MRGVIVILHEKSSSGWVKHYALLREISKVDPHRADIVYIRYGDVLPCTETVWNAPHRKVNSRNDRFFWHYPAKEGEE